MKVYTYRLDPRAKDVPEYMRTLEAIFVTPADAPRIKRAPNRTRKTARYRQMVEDQRTGQWDREKPNLVWFNLADELTEGQHRVDAVAESGIAGIWLLKVKTRCDPSTAVDVIPRSVPDAFSQRGVPNATLAVAMLGLQRRLDELGGNARQLIARLRARKRGKSITHAAFARFSDLWPLYERHRQDIDACTAEAKAFIEQARDTRGATALTPSDVAFAFWMARVSPRRDAKDLVKRLVIATRADAFKRDEPKVAKAFNAIMASHRRNRFGNGGSTERLSYALELIAA